MANIAIEDIVPSALDATDQVLVRRGAGPLDHTMALVDPADFGGGGATGGSTGEVQYNNAGAFAGAADVEIEGGQLRLPSISTPTAPASGGVKIYGADYAGQVYPAFIGPTGGEMLVQTLLHTGQLRLWAPVTGTTTNSFGTNVATAGTATTAAFAVNSRRGRVRKISYLITTPSTTAVAHWRDSQNQSSVGGQNSWEGGFRYTIYAGPATGHSNSARRFFCGMWGTGAPTDLDPSAQTDIIGIGYASGDTNVQFIHNDSSGTATKVDLGTDFPKPSVDNTSMYRLEMFSPPGTTSIVGYRVTNLESGIVVSGSVTTDLPGNGNVDMKPVIWASAGGTSDVTGITVGPMLMQTEL
jgi:hypothetical protein